MRSRRFRWIRRAWTEVNGFPRLASHRIALPEIPQLSVARVPGGDK